LYQGVLLEPRRQQFSCLQCLQAAAAVMQQTQVQRRGRASQLELVQLMCPWGMQRSTQMQQQVKHLRDVIAVLAVAWPSCRGLGTSALQRGRHMLLRVQTMSSLLCMAALGASSTMQQGNCHILQQAVMAITALATRLTATVVPM
jgi:hypothetical protein